MSFARSASGAAHEFVPANFSILVGLSLSHCFNDVIQVLLPAIYPLLKTQFALDFVQIGLLTFVYRIIASVLQPVVGTVTDHRPQPYSLALGMTFTLVGLVLLARAGSFNVLLLASVFIGLGSSIFHPEASRVARLASGGHHGFAQSFFQVGGNLGTAVGPLLAAAIVMPFGLHYSLWFALLAAAGIIVLTRVGGWYQRVLRPSRAGPPSRHPGGWHAQLTRGRITRALVVLGVLVFSKYFYLACLTNYYTFYLIERFQLSARQSQVFLFLFLFGVAAGTMLGGPASDRWGRKPVIWISILGVAPFTLLLPYVGLAATAVLSVVIGVILASAFPAIIVYGQELLPGRIGLINGIFFGFAFGMGGIGSALLGALADHTSIQYIFELCGYLPLLGLFTAFLPNLKHLREHAATA